MEKELKVAYKDCEVLENYKNKVIVKLPKQEGEKHSQKLVARAGEKMIVGDVVSVYRASILNRIQEILLYISPAIYFLFGFGFGFFFKTELYHYLLALGMAVIGFAQLILFIFIIKSSPKFKYIARKTAFITKKQKEEAIIGEIEKVEEKFLQTAIAAQPIVDQVADDVIEVISEIV